MIIYISVCSSSGVLVRFFSTTGKKKPAYVATPPPPSQKTSTFTIDSLSKRPPGKRVRRRGKNAFSQDFKKSPVFTNRFGEISFAPNSHKKTAKGHVNKFGYRGSKFRAKQRVYFKKAHKLRRFRRRIRRFFLRKKKRFLRSKPFVLLSVARAFRRPRSPRTISFVVARHIRVLRKFKRKTLKLRSKRRLARVRARRRSRRGRKLLKIRKRLKSKRRKFRRKKRFAVRRRRHPNVYAQFRARYNYFATYFKLTSHSFGRKLGRNLGIAALRKGFFASPAYRSKLLFYALTAPKLRQNFKYPFPLSLVGRRRQFGLMDSTFRRRAAALFLNSKNVFRIRTVRRRKTASKYLVLSRYDLHRRYFRNLRRRGPRRNFIIYPTVGFVGRRARLHKRRYGSLLNFFVRKPRFRKLRRYVRLRRRKRTLVPMLRTRRRHRRLYRALPAIFQKRSFSYVFIKQTTNNIFYSVFSRKKRLLANFSNGRTEFLGSKRMSTVASEAAAKVLLSYFEANRIRTVFFIFGSRFNHFMRAAIKVFRARRIKIAGFKYRMRKAHSLGLRRRASRRV